MNRWVLLEHKILNINVEDIHYDFLIEDRKDCLTWKLYEIPDFDKGFIQIGKQPNHRLVWLYRLEHKLSNDRGLVKRIDHGTFKQISHQFNSQEVKFILNGKLLNGLFEIKGSSCQLTKHN